MKLLGYLKKTSSLKFHSLAFEGDCLFQREVFLLRLHSDLQKESKKNIRLQYLSMKDTPFQEVYDFLYQPRLMAKRELFLIEDLNALGPSQKQKIIDAAFSGKNPNILRVLCVEKNMKLKGIPGEFKIEQERNFPNLLEDITNRAMELLRLPKSAYIAKQLVENFRFEPLTILSELRKLYCFLDEDQASYVSRDELPLSKPSGEQTYFEFLDRLGTRSYKRSIQEYMKLHVNQTEEASPKFLGAVKSHFRKLLDLKNWTEPLDELRLVKLAHRYFTSVSYREKTAQMEKVRQYYRERLEETELKRFEKMFRADIYLAKLLYQQKAYQKNELLEFLGRLTLIQGRLQSSSVRLEQEVLRLIGDYCLRDRKAG